MNTTGSRIAVGLITCLCAVTLVGCGSSSTKGSAPPSTTDAGGSTAAPDTTSGGGGGNTVATCKQLTNSDVQPLVVQTITTVVVRPGNPTDGNGQTCVWATSSTSSALTITVLSGDDAKNQYQSDLASITPVAVGGVGDKAARDGGHGTTTLSSVKGDLYCSVSPGDGEVPGVAQLEDAAGNTSNIGDKAYGEIADAVGTLCNRIYGSGNTTPDLTDLKSSGAAAASQPTTTAPLPTGFTVPTDGGSTP